MHDIELAPSTARRAVDGRDAVTEHDPTVRTIVRLQRLAGNASVVALLAEHASSRFEGPPSIQRLSRDLQVTGKFEGASSQPKQVFLDFNSAVVDGEERAKIDQFPAHVPAPDRGHGHHERRGR